MRADLYWVEGPWDGRLAILARPRGGDWLEDEVQGWRREGIDAVVSLLTDREIAELELEQEAAYCRASGIQLLSFPIADRSVPSSRSATLGLVKRLEQNLAEGKRIGVHCRQGIGRSAMIAAYLLTLTGLDPETAFERVGAARRRPVPDTSQQREWVVACAQQAAMPLAGIG